jgi:hypothetical protein
LDLPGRLWSLGRKVEDLLDLQIETGEALEAMGDRLNAQEDRVTHLGANQAQRIVQGRAAALTLGFKGPITPIQGTRG